ncbi:MAG: FHA domain-containing protein [Candidatus Eisenbacteria bacterium]|uniref:FHA domain-containing protein n=1 Tax=Eiseniibacteriota bacterium TaxID=2212470 RepID=A0A933SFZ4_UNCEI|nr:FHA domain-containing protein [Candidatus Eisenbacteria bacterium]
MPESTVLKLRLSLMGRPVRNYTFDKPVVCVGRDPEADIFVDNPGVSRDHFRLERTPTGEYQITDLGSANGTFLNDQMVNAATVRNNDVVRFGKYTLWVGYEHDRRSGADHAAAPPPTQGNTVVLSRSELGSLFDAVRERETNPPAAPAAAAPAAAPVRVAAPAPASSAAVVIAFLLGAALGAGAAYLLLTR